MGKRNSLSNPDARDNVGQFLGDIYLWETAAKFCATRKKEAWEAAVATDLVKDKEFYRGYPDSMSEVVSSPGFACTVKVSVPRKAFDRDAFINQVAKRFKIDKADLVQVAQRCMKEGAPSVSLTVMEKS